MTSIFERHTPWTAKLDYYSVEHDGVIKLFNKFFSREIVNG
ncbi:hypothetical protein ANO14919_119600 [Xylariales sp. No.14919]|nr:hypothetical protein ANO14919_119600 [Xylariales sp. No.14919]